MRDQRSGELELQARVKGLGRSSASTSVSVSAYSRLSLHFNYPSLASPFPFTYNEVKAMVQPRAAQPRVADMGQTSSQLGPPQSTQQPGMEEPRRGKSKKSKSKKHRRDEGIIDPEAERPAVETESARALMQLSSSALHYGDRAPYYNQDNNMPVQTQIVSPAAGEQAADEEYPQEMENGGLRKKNKKKKKSRGVDKKVRGEMEEETFPSTPPGQTSVSPRRTHPLDNEPSDDERVQEYEAGVSQDQLYQIHSFSQQPNDSLEEKRSQNPMEHAYQLPTTAQTSPQAQKKKKSSSKKRRRHTEATAAGDAQDDNMPIDPELHSIGAVQPSTQQDPLDESGSDYIPGDHSKNRHKRRRVDTTEHVDEGDTYGHSHNGNNHQEPQGDEILQGLEDEKGVLSREIGTPYTEDTDVEELRRQAKSKKKSRKSSGASAGSRSGFNADEISKLDDFRNNYCAANDLSIEGFNHFIQMSIRGNEITVNIFKEIQDLFPDRTRSSVQRFCRRRFHNFHARGVWTPQEDADLKEAVVRKGTAWKVVGEEIGRFAEDCRDRYRNYLAPSAEHRNRDAWTETEVINLSHSILDCMRKMKHERQRAKEEEWGHEVPMSDTDSDQEAEDLKLINWQTVSDTMGSYGTARSRIQCSFKWSKIKQADRDRYLKEIKEAQKSLRNLERGAYSANNMKRSTGWRLRAASKQVMNMKSGDKYDLLNAILNSAAPGEENIPWRLIGDDAFRKKWSFAERKAGWLTMKKQIEGSEHMDYRQVVHQLLTELLAHGVNERWNPEVDGYVDGSPVKRPRASKKNGKSSKNSTRRRKQARGESTAQQEGARSNEYVLDSDEVDEPSVAAPTANMADRGQDRGSESPNSLFDGDKSPTYDEPTTNEQGPAFGGVSPELAGKIHMLQGAY